MDAGTLYDNVLRYMNENPSRKNQWKLISIICFAEPDIDGCYLSEADYCRCGGRCASRYVWRSLLPWPLAG